MDFRKELAKELGLGAISENTMLDDYVKACEAIAIRYHESEVKKLRLSAVSWQSEQLKAFADYVQGRMWEGEDKDLSEFVEEFLSL